MGPVVVGRHLLATFAALWLEPPANIVRLAVVTAASRATSRRSAGRKERTKWKKPATGTTLRALTVTGGRTRTTAAGLRQSEEPSGCVVHHRVEKTSKDETPGVEVPTHEFWTRFEEDLSERLLGLSG